MRRLLVKVTREPTNETMSVVLQNILSDAKQLVNRLKDSDNTADVLLKETNSIAKKIDSIRKYQEDVGVLNDTSKQRPHSQLINSMQQETRNMREVQQENRELRALLNEHQIALEHIMSKYREHTSRQIYETRIDFSKFDCNNNKSEVVDKQEERIREMASVMQQAADLDDDSVIFKFQETINKLAIENRGLREMLGIAYTHGSGASLSTTQDKHIQTDLNAVSDTTVPASNDTNDADDSCLSNEESDLNCSATSDKTVIEVKQG